jgi:AraC family transcriptional activator of pyochelin receptor
MTEAVIVSAEMTTLVGGGQIPVAKLPSDAVAFVVSGTARGSTLTCCDNSVLERFRASPLILVVQRAACERLFAVRPPVGDAWHLPSKLLALALSIIDCEATGEARTTLRLARSIELLCQIHANYADEALMPEGGEGALSELDVARIASVRRLVDQRWQEKLTIAELARAGGLNRDKLVRGFRGLYGATILEVLTERRLAEARSMLLGTDLPVASVAYRCSYLNNAAFTRAFSRRFGVAPSTLRRTGAAA